jgi:hypothetical protein
LVPPWTYTERQKQILVLGLALSVWRFARLTPALAWTAAVAQ